MNSVECVVHSDVSGPVCHADSTTSRPQLQVQTTRSSALHADADGSTRAPGGRLRGTVHGDAVDAGGGRRLLRGRAGWGRPDPTKSKLPSTPQLLLNYGPKCCELTGRPPASKLQRWQWYIDCERSWSRRPSNSEPARSARLPRLPMRRARMHRHAAAGVRPEKFPLPNKGNHHVQNFVFLHQTAWTRLQDMRKFGQIVTSDRPNLSSLTPLFKGLDVPSKIGLLLAHGSKFGWMPLLPPPVTHIGTSGSWTPACWAQVHRFNRWASAVLCKVLSKSIQTQNTELHFVLLRIRYAHN